MKRYRVLRMDFDSRPWLLGMEIRDDWQPHVKAQHEVNKRIIREGLVAEYGTADRARKERDFLDMGLLPFSVVAFHNRSLHQVRTAFVAGGYYAALTGTCALGERVLNHLILGLRESFRETPEYKRVYRKDSFNDWELAISTLESWQILLPGAAAAFRKLMDTRHRSLHFHPETDQNERQLALTAMQQFGEIVREQFSAAGSQPWFMRGTPGMSLLKKDWESNPFIRLVYIPNCALVGPRHRLQVEPGGWRVWDENQYEEREVTDDEFVKLLTEKGSRGKGIARQR